MADNSVADPGAGGDTFRTKDRAGVKTEVVGLDLTPGGGSETLMNGVMPVSDNSGSLTVDNAGTFAVQADTELTTADLDSGAGTDTRAVVGLVIAKSGGAANISATDPLPVVVGSTTPVQIQGGANQIGKLAANSGVDIGDVDVTSSALPTGAATAAKQPALGTAGSASTDVITVQGIASGTVVPVSGTVTANLGTAAVTNAGTFAVQIAANSSINNAQVAGTATSVNSGTKDAGTQRVILASDQTVVPISDNSGSLTVDAPLATPVFSTPTPSTTGGWSKSAFAALTNTKTLIKNAAGTFGGYLTVYNPNATVAYVQIFDVAATASVTLGTTVADARIIVPATSAANMEVTNGVNMANGIVIACTTTATGSTAPGAGLDGTILYK